MKGNETLTFNVTTDMEKERTNKRLTALAQAFVENAKKTDDKKN